MAGLNAQDMGWFQGPKRNLTNGYDNAPSWGFQQQVTQPWAQPQINPQTYLNYQAFGQGNNYASSDPWAMLQNGVGTMNGLGGTIGATFALANQQSGQNLAANYAANAAINQGLGAANVAAQAQMYESQQRNQRIKDALPLFAAIIGRLGGGSGGGSTGFSTNYGAGGHI